MPAVANHASLSLHVPPERSDKLSAFAKRCLASGSLHQCRAGEVGEVIVSLPGLSSGSAHGTVKLGATVWRPVAAGHRAEQLTAAEVPVPLATHRPGVQCVQVCILASRKSWCPPA